MQKIDIQQLISILRNEIEYVTVNSKVLFSDYIRDIINHANSIAIGVNDNNEQKVMIIVQKTTNGLWVECNNKMLNNSIKTSYLNDYPDVIDEDDGFLKINASKSIPWRKIRALIKAVERESEVES